jgi:alanine racemase
VAYADEGVELRKAGITVPIMVLNVDENSFAALIEYNLQPVLFSLPVLEQFEAYLKAQALPLWPVHLEIETGMNRLGFALEDLDHTAKHIAALSLLQQHLTYPFLKHISNSAAIIRHPQLQLDMVRLGIGLYGVGEKKLDLHPAATLRSTIAQIKQLKTGETVSYNRRGVVTRDSLIATVRIGYADGYSRMFGNGVGKMVVNGVLVPVIGAVCMDMTMLDVTDVPDVKEGGDVIVFGAGLPVQNIARWINTIPYEIMTGISQRVKRVYFQE